MTYRVRKLKPADTRSPLEIAFEERGPKAIETVRRLDPSAYIAAIARLVRDL